jgi:hypothetical protein
VASSWDRRSAGQQTKTAETAFQTQLTERLARFSPYWRETVRGAGIRVADLHGIADLAKVPAIGERDLCPDGTAAGAAKLVLHTGEAGFAVHADGTRFRRALRERVTSPARYRRTVDAAVRPVAYHLGGLAFRFPIASTRDDLDLVARAGARMWQVLGLTDADVLVSALPTASTLTGFALPYACIGAGAPAVHAGLNGAAEALAAVPATVVAVRDAAMLDALLSRRGDVLPDTVTTVLVTGDDDGVAALSGNATVLRVWGPGEGRWLWAECREGGRATGLHTYPDLEVLETLDPATTEPASAAGELTLTQLSTYGSALVRWRSGALHGGLLTDPCPACGRTVPRVAPDLRPGALVRAADVGGTPTVLDLRAVAGALAGRDDLTGWAVTVTDNPADGAPLVLARIAPSAAGSASDAAIAAYVDIEAVAGSGPTQVVVDPSVGGRAELSAA